MAGQMMDLRALVESEGRATGSNASRAPMPTCSAI
jgi:hypothetical protein